MVSAMRNIKHFLVAILLGGLLASSAFASEITVMSFGGAYFKSQKEAYYKPFTAKTGIEVKAIDDIDPAVPLKAQAEAGNVWVDVGVLDLADSERYCNEGLLESIDSSVLPSARDGTPASEDFFAGGIQRCAVANVFFSAVFAYNTETNANAPKTIADFFDVVNFPGKRGVRSEANVTLEMALMADGVAPRNVYKVLSTEAGVARAFAKLDSIRDHIVWWKSGGRPSQLLGDGEVAMSIGYNGRLFDAVVREGLPLEIVWDGQVLDLALFVIPKGAPNKEDALKFIAFATSAEPLAAQASWVSYGPARKSSVPLVGVYKDGKTHMAPHMPNAPANLKNALVTGYKFWADNDAKLNQRFEAWLAQ